MRRAALFAAGMAAAMLLIAAARPPEWRWTLPDGVAPPPVPADNPMSMAKVELGRRLFYDADLSINGTMSCASCHEQRHGFADSNATRPGALGDPGRRNAPALANIGYAAALTWADPRVTTLEAQVAIPLLGEHPVEMGMKDHEAEIGRRLARDDCYVRMFAKAFPGADAGINMLKVTRALAAFQRGMIAVDTPFDRYQRGEADAMPPAARRGAALFMGSAGCANCHSGPQLTDGRYHALEDEAGQADQGLSEATGLATDRGKFRTPGLRNVALTAPYMHDGGTSSLPAVIRRHRKVLPSVTGMPDEQESDLIAFLNALTDQRFISDPRLARPAKACGKRL